MPRFAAARPTPPPSLLLFQIGTPTGELAADVADERHAVVVGGVLEERRDAAAVRLGVTGSYDAQRLQSECAGWSATVLARYRDAGPADLAQTAPFIDILQGAHDRLYSRLFQS